MNRFQKIAKARNMGCKMSYKAWRASRATGVPMWFICAILEQETSGGRNIFGQDPTIFVRAGEVTKEKYWAYKVERIRSGNRKMQGVGPMQLTWWEFQDEADRAGGCWKPYINILTGARILKRWKTPSIPWVETTKRWNSGTEYQSEIRRICEKWRRAFT